MGVEGVAVLELEPLIPAEDEDPLMPLLEDEPLDIAPVEPVLLEELASAPVAGVGEGAVVVDGAGALGAGAGAGAVTVSSFLQAIKPTATMAARTSERFMFFPLGEASHG